MEIWNPLVSIITPTFNHERFIAECIESVLAQAYSNWEMLIVDDGSNDHTWEIVQTYVAKDQRIRAFDQENKSIWRLAETYNFALEHARGELIAILEGDDVWLPSKLAVQVPVHMSGGYSLTFGQIQFIDASGALISKARYPDPKRLPFLQNPISSELFLRLLRGEYFLPAVTVLISRSSLAELSGFQQPPYLPVVDYPTWISIGANSQGIGVVPEVLAFWRQHSAQSTWLLARDIARGVYRFAIEFAEKQQFKFGPTTDIKTYLLSPSRRNFLADASYRTAAISFERGAIRKALTYCAEIAELGNYRLFARCLAMFAWKLTHRVTQMASKSLSLRNLFL